MLPLDWSVNCTTRGALPEAGLALKFAAGGGGGSANGLWYAPMSTTPLVVLGLPSRSNALAIHGWTTPAPMHGDVDARWKLPFVRSRNCGSWRMFPTPPGSGRVQQWSKIPGPALNHWLSGAGGASPTK